MNFGRSIVLAAVLLWWPCIGQAQSNKDLYGLQERCGKQAEERFQGIGKQRETAGYTFSFDFENHYSLRLNKCFFLLTLFQTEIKSPDKGGKFMWLHDLNDIAQYYGEYVHYSGLLAFCEVRGKQCRSEEEWRELIKPFMED